VEVPVWPFPKRQRLTEMSSPLDRVELLRRGRIAILDDESPEMLEDLRKQGLSVDHIPSTEHPNFHRLETAFYDVLLLDYGGIGARFGDEGIDVLRHLKRVNPSLRIVAFSARTFDASKSDFFRLCDDVVRKDSGIRELLEEIEEHLRAALTPAAAWNATCSVLQIQPDSRTGRRIEKLVLELPTKPRAWPKLKAVIASSAVTGFGKIGEALVQKTAELVTAWVQGGGPHQ
jgi:DNA-binding response OmpR family regulator